MVADFLLESLATFVGIVSSFAMIPQVYRIFKRRSAKDLSISTYSFMVVAGVIWVLYGLNIQNYPIVVTNLIGTLSLLAIVLGWILYGR